ncbi:MAG: Uncharacterized protein E1N59_1319 [Puniceicoccaceae bacterium 5H]|nr:MAG: Uncharacterized protein E1N59_1319 [Puniceicoccaceae bacterium 5H]
MKLWPLLALPAASLAAAPSLPTSLEVNSGLTPVFPFPSFGWADSSGATHYEVQVSDDAYFSNLLVDETSRISRYAQPVGLPAGTLYWRVRAVDAAATTSSWATGGSFSVSTPVTVVNVDTSDTAADIQSAIDAALGSGAVYVEFASGTYHLEPPSSASYDFVLNLRYADNVWINGQGAEIIMESATSGFVFLDDTTNVLIEDFVIDYDPLPYATGTVVSKSSAGTGSVTIEVNANSPAFDDPQMQASWTSWGCILDPNIDGKLKDGAYLLYSFDQSDVSQSTTDPDQYIFTLSSTGYLKYFDAGDRYVHFAREGCQPLFSADRATGVTFADITNYAAPAGHYSMMWSRDVKVLGCDSLIASGRSWGANADFVHCRSNSIGPWVEDCTVEGIGDDIVALYLKGIKIVDIDDTDPTLVTIQQDSSHSVYTGDQLELFSPQNGTVLGSYEVVTRTSLGGGQYQLHLDQALNESALTLSGARDEVDQFFDYSRSNRNFAIRNNTFGPGRRHGAIIRATEGVVEGNTFTMLGSAGVIFENEADLWFNGLYSQSVQLVDNTFDRCTFVKNATEQGSITLRIAKSDRTDSAEALHGDLLIQNNTIRDWSHHAIKVGNANGVEVRDNEILSTVSGFYVPSVDNVIFDIAHSDDVLIDGNDFSGESRAVDATFQVTDSTNVVNNDD